MLTVTATNGGQMLSLSEQSYLDDLSSETLSAFRESLDLKVQLERGNFITVYLETKRSREDPHYPAVVWQAKGFQILPCLLGCRPPLGHKLNAWVDKWFGDEIFKRAFGELFFGSIDVMNHCRDEFDRGAEVVVMYGWFATTKKVTLKKSPDVIQNSFTFEDTEGGFWLARDILAMF
jgi:hypothetical protein